jgi:hypothetical protein
VNSKSAIGLVVMVQPNSAPVVVVLGLPSLNQIALFVVLELRKFVELELVLGQPMVPALGCPILVLVVVAM